METSRTPARFDRLFARLFLVLSVLFLFGVLPVKADEQVVMVGLYENAPKIFTSPSGSPAGIYVDIIEHIAKIEGWHISYVAGTWGEGLDRLAQGAIDLMPDVGYTSERAATYSFHKIPALSSWFQVYAAKGSNVKTILDLNGKRILVLDRSIQQEAFDRLSKGFGLSTTIIPMADYQTMFELVAKGDADAAITNSFYGLLHAKKFGLEDTTVIFEPSDLYYAAGKGDPKHLLAAIDRILGDLKKDPQSMYYASIKRWTSERVRFSLPTWLSTVGTGLISFLIISVVVSVLLKHQVNVRTKELQRENAERQIAQQRLMDIIEFLPDATFVVDGNKRIFAWNKVCEGMTGVKKEMMLGFDDYAYAEPFYGERRPTLIDLLDQGIPEVEATFTNITWKNGRLYAESFSPRLRDGQGAYLWGVASPLYDRDGQRCGAIETIRDITDQKLIAEALQKSEREYRELVMLANSIILRWSPAGQIVFLNEFGQHFFGYTAEEISGRQLVGSIVPEDDCNGSNLQMMIAEIAADPIKYERNINENILRNGQRVWIDWTNKAVLDAQGKIKEILSIGSDITKRRQVEKEVQRLNEDLRRHAETLEQRVAERTEELVAINDEQRTIFESASTGIVLLRDRVIVRCNRKLEEISGYEHGELVGKSTRIWYPNEEAFLVSGKDVYAQMAKGDTYRKEQQMLRKDGSLYWVRLSLCAFDKNAPMKGAVGIIEDITDEREAAENLQKALEAAQAADRIKSAFLATMSHELRTPLNSIIGFTGIMLQGLTGPLNPEQHKQMTMVQKSSRHLLALINDVLDISKIEAGQLDLVPTDFALRPSIEKMVALIAPLAEQKGIALHTEISSDIGMMNTDQRRLEQVILNLLNNAVKFTAKGSVHLACQVTKDMYFLSVSDTGMGIRPEELARIFQPFYQINSGLSRKHEGSGLGLSICKKIVEMMHGSIEVESQWGQGSTFTLRLPRQAGGSV